MWGHTRNKVLLGHRVAIRIARHRSIWHWWENHVRRRCHIWRHGLAHIWHVRRYHGGHAKGWHVHAHLRCHSALGREARLEALGSRGRWRRAHIRHTRSRYTGRRTCKNNNKDKISGQNQHVHPNLVDRLVSNSYTSVIHSVWNRSQCSRSISGPSERPMFEAKQYH